MISAKYTQFSSRHRARGFTLLELVVVISIISILFVVAVDKLLKLEVEAERVSVLQLQGILQSALALQIAAHVARDELPKLNRFIASNPMALLAETPVNYLGARRAVDPATIKGGHWYYAEDEQSLVYRVKNADYFRTPLPGPARIRFRILPVYDDNNGTGRYEAAGDTLKGLSLTSLEAYTWLNQPVTVEEYLD